MKAAAAVGRGEGDNFSICVCFVHGLQYERGREKGEGGDGSFLPSREGVLNSSSRMDYLPQKLGWLKSTSCVPRATGAMVFVACGREDLGACGRESCCVCCLRC